MLSHCLGRLSNFNWYVAYINQSMGLNASCFIGGKKTLASHITWHVTRQFHSVTRQGHTLWHRHRKRWASITDVWLAKIQHWFNA